MRVSAEAARTFCRACSAAEPEAAAAENWESPCCIAPLSGTAAEASASIDRRISAVARSNFSASHRWNVDDD